jgi:hypothetical protein
MSILVFKLISKKFNYQFYILLVASEFHTKKKKSEFYAIY